MNFEFANLVKSIRKRVEWKYLTKSEINAFFADSILFNQVTIDYIVDLIYNYYRRPEMSMSEIIRHMTPLSSDKLYIYSNALNKYTDTIYVPDEHKPLHFESRKSENTFMVQVMNTVIALRYRDTPKPIPLKVRTFIKGTIVPVFGILYIYGPLPLVISPDTKQILKSLTNYSYEMQYRKRNVESIVLQNINRQFFRNDLFKSDIGTYNGVHIPVGEIYMKIYNFYNQRKLQDISGDQNLLSNYQYHTDTKIFYRKHMNEMYYTALIGTNYDTNERRHQIVFEGYDYGQLYFNYRFNRPYKTEYYITLLNQKLHLYSLAQIIRTRKILYDILVYKYGQIYGPKKLKALVQKYTEGESSIESYLSETENKALTERDRFIEVQNKITNDLRIPLTQYRLIYDNEEYTEVKRRNSFIKMWKSCRKTFITEDHQYGCKFKDIIFDIRRSKFGTITTKQEHDIRQMFIENITNIDNTNLTPLTINELTFNELTREYKNTSYIFACEHEVEKIINKMDQNELVQAFGTGSFNVDSTYICCKYCGRPIYKVEDASFHGYEEDIGIEQVVVKHAFLSNFLEFVNFTRHATNHLVDDVFFNAVKMQEVLENILFELYEKLYTEYTPGEYKKMQTYYALLYSFALATFFNIKRGIPFITAIPLKTNREKLRFMFRMMYDKNKSAIPETKQEEEVYEDFITIYKSFKNIPEIYELEKPNEADYSETFCNIITTIIYKTIIEYDMENLGPDAIINKMQTIEQSQRKRRGEGDRGFVWAKKIDEFRRLEKERTETIQTRVTELKLPDIPFYKQLRILMLNRVTPFDAVPGYISRNDFTILDSIKWLMHGQYQNAHYSLRLGTCKWFEYVARIKPLLVSSITYDLNGVAIKPVKVHIGRAEYKVSELMSQIKKLTNNGTIMNSDIIKLYDGRGISNRRTADNTFSIIFDNESHKPVNGIKAKEYSEKQINDIREIIIDKEKRKILRVFKEYLEKIFPMIFQNNSRKSIGDFIYRTVTNKNLEDCYNHCLSYIPKREIILEQRKTRPPKGITATDSIFEQFIRIPEKQMKKINTYLVPFLQSQNNFFETPEIFYTKLEEIFRDKSKNEIIKITKSIILSIFYVVNIYIRKHDIFRSKYNILINDRKLLGEKHLSEICIGLIYGMLYDINGLQYTEKATVLQHFYETVLLYMFSNTETYQNIEREIILYRIKHVRREMEEQPEEPSTEIITSTGDQDILDIEEDEETKFDRNKEDYGPDMYDTEGSEEEQYTTYEIQPYN